MEEKYVPKIPFEWQERKRWLNLPVPIEEYRSRLHKLQEAMGRDRIDCMIVYGGLSDKANLLYMCGYDSWFGDTMLFVPKDGEDLIFATNAVFHGELAHSNMHTHWIKNIRFVLHPHSVEKPKLVSDLVAEILKDKGLATGKIAVCNVDTVPFHLMKALYDLLPSADIVQGTTYLKNLRRIKSTHEIELIKKACECTDTGINKALQLLEPGMTEREVFTTIGTEAFARGADTFMASVLFGPRSAIKNILVPSDYRLKEGEIVNMDVISKVAGYTTDTHRNAIVGKPKDDLTVRMPDAVLEAGLKVLEKTGPDVVIYDLQMIMFEHMKKAGLLDYDFTETLFAHGFGLDLVEEPYFFWGNKQKLEPGMTFFLEPCLVKHGLGTACWESTILITDTGYERLSHANDKNW